MSLNETGREAEVRRALDRVTDPELDEPVTDLRFIDRLTIWGGAVSIGFRLPTYWCAANFAFLMADDMRREVGALPWVKHVEVTLGEHMYADKINHGLAHGLSFRDTFGNDASAELDELRRTFLVKAFQRRQEALLRYLLKYPAPQGVDGGPAPAMTKVQRPSPAMTEGAAPTRAMTPETLVAMTLPALKALPVDPEGDQIRRRYLDRRHICAAPGEPLAFVDAQGEAIGAESLHGYLQALGRVTINAEFNGALCRGLLAARFNEDGEPSLADFARMPGTA
nr:iron-sulfur cluster assembly protein [uncultured Rhodopila sp.]